MIDGYTAEPSFRFRQQLLLPDQPYASLPCFPVFHGFIFHFISMGFLTGQNIFPLDVRIHHYHRSSIIIHFPDNYWHLFHSCQFTRPPSAVPCHHLILTITIRTYNSRHQYSISFYTFHSLLHFFIIQYPEWMVFEGVKKTNRNGYNLLFCRYFTTAK